MSKRSNESSRESSSTPAAQKMFDGKQNGSSSRAPAQKKIYRYHQGTINVASSYLSPEFADVHFEFKLDDDINTRVPAHKNLLVAASDVFEKMFCGELREAGDIKIVDATEAEFKEFLQFFYLNEVKLSAKHLASVLNFGNKYNVKNCFDACLKFFINGLTTENVCTALSLGILHGQKELTKSCEEEIMVNTADVFKSRDFVQCDKEVLAHILQMEPLSCTEIDVFEAAMEWVRGKSKQAVLSKALVEQHLGDSFYQIRFASMKFEEFCALEKKYSAVLSSDFGAIGRIIGGTSIDSERFNTSPRKTPREIKWNGDEDAILYCDLFDPQRDDDGETEWHDIETEEKTTFSTSEQLLLGEFTHYVIFLDDGHRSYPQTELPVNVTITEARTLDGANAKVVSSWTAYVLPKESDISLPHPILIRPNFFYTIAMKGIPEGHCFGSTNHVRLMTLDSGAEIHFHKEDAVEFFFELRFNEV